MVEKILKSTENSSSKHTRGAVFCLYSVLCAEWLHLVCSKSQREDNSVDECQNFPSGKFGSVRWGVDLEPKLCCFKSSGHWKVREEMGH